MAANDRSFRKGARPLAEIAAEALAPACRKRGFATVDLVAHWPDIVGPPYAATTQPEKLAWTRVPQGIIDENEPATLTLRCVGAVALRLQHELPVVIERINRFFGYAAVGRVKLVQMPPVVRRRAAMKPAPVLPAPEETALAGRLAGIEDDGLRAAVMRLGRAVTASTITKR
jgi:hypothetical protein